MTRKQMFFATLVMLALCVGYVIGVHVGAANNQTNAVRQHGGTNR